MSAQPVNRDAWRSLVIEEPIDPGLPIIDAHHHLWPEPPVPHLEAYGIEALQLDKRTCGHNIVATVYGCDGHCCFLGRAKLRKCSAGC
jgi:hypothetical protein